MITVRLNVTNYEPRNSVFPVRRIARCPRLRCRPLKRVGKLITDSRNSVSGELIENSANFRAARPDQIARPPVANDHKEN